MHRYDRPRLYSVRSIIMFFALIVAVLVGVAPTLQMTARYFMQTANNGDCSQTKQKAKKQQAIDR
jgi:hypothetical protein